MGVQDKNKYIHVRITQSEYEKVKTLAKHNKMTVPDYVRSMVLNDGCSLIQLRMMLTEMDNTLSNILLAEKINMASATEMFRNLSTRITVGNRNPATISTEEGDKINKGIENSINLVKTAAMDSVFKHYTDATASDPSGLDVFAKKINEM